MGHAWGRDGRGGLKIKWDTTLTSWGLCIKSEELPGGEEAFKQFVLCSIQPFSCILSFIQLYISTSFQKSPTSLRRWKFRKLSPFSICTSTTLSSISRALSSQPQLWFLSRWRNGQLGSHAALRYIHPCTHLPCPSTTHSYDASLLKSAPYLPMSTFHNH